MIFNFLEKQLTKRRLNLLYTLYINFRLFCFKQAIQLPIYIYGWPKIYKTARRAFCDGPIQRGMIKVNPLVIGRMAAQAQPVELYIAGKITFRGKCVIRSGTVLTVREKASLTIGNDVRICEHCRICCNDTSIDIGDFASISHYVQILDSSFHYIADFNRYVIPNKSKQVKIGNYCWICNSSSIAPGAIIPDYTIVASNSIVNKDFSNIPPMSLIGGTPSRLLKSNIKRVWYEAQNVSNLHKYLDSYFCKNANASVYEFHNSIKPVDLDIIVT